MKSSVTHEGALFGKNREQAIRIIEEFVFPLSRRELPARIDEALDAIAALVVKQIEEDRQSRYGGQNEGV
jgi:uncharacterized protein YpiB (UPF0302 family)